MIELTVKTLDAQNHEFSVEDECTVSELKQRIAGRIGLAPEMQRLIFRGRVLADTTRLSQLDVNGKVVHLVEREPPRAGQRAGGSTAETGDTPPQQQRGRPRFGGLGGPITAQQMENVLLEAIGIRGFPADGGAGVGFRGMAADDSSPQVGPTMVRMALVRRMLDHITSNMTALDQMAASLPNLSDEAPPASTEESVPATSTSAQSVASQSETDAGAAAMESEMDAASVPLDTSAGEPMISDPPAGEEDAAQMSEEWVDASDDRDSAAGLAFNTSTTQASTAATPAPDPQADVNEGRRPNAAPWETEDTEERSRRAGREMVSVLRDLTGLQENLTRHLTAFADALQERHTVGSERMRVRQRMVRRMSDTMHNLSHLYHALSDVEVTLTGQHPRCLSTPPPRRVQIPIQTQINVMSNRRPPAAGAAPAQPTSAASAAPRETGSVTVTSSNANATPGSVPSQTSTDPQPAAARQPTVHVDIRPEPLSYQVEIETRVPIAFINNGQGLHAGIDVAGMNAAAARLNSTANGTAAPTAASLNAAAESISATLNAAGLGGTWTSEGNVGGASAAVGGATQAAPPSGGQQGQQAFNQVLLEQGGDFIMGVSVPINWESINQGQPHLIAGPFPFGGGGGGAVDLIQSVVQSALQQELGAGNIGPPPGFGPMQAGASQGAGAAAPGVGGAPPAGQNRQATIAAAAAAAATRRGRVRRPLRSGQQRQQQPIFAPYRPPVFDRFLPCRYDVSRRTRARRADDRMTELGAAMRASRYSRPAQRNTNLPAEPTLADVLTALHGYTIADFVDMEQHLPGESWLVDVLMIFSREMTAAELLSAWSNASPAVSSLRGALRSFVRSTVLGGARPRDAADALQLYTLAADTFVDQNRPVLQWIDSVVGVNPRVDLERSLRALARARLPQILLTLSEEPQPGDNFAARVVALVSRAFSDACALVQHAGRERSATLHVLFGAYVDDFLQHLEPPLLRTLVDLVAPSVLRFSSSLSISSVLQYVVRRPSPPPAAPQPPPPETTAQTAPAPMDADLSPPRPPTDLSRGGFNLGAMRGVRPRLAPYLTPGLSPTHSPRPVVMLPRPAATADSAATVQDSPAPPSMPEEWAAAVRRDAARQRIAGAPRTPYSDAYLSGAPPRKRKLLQQGKPQDLTDMMQECIREATQNVAPSAEVPGGAARGDAGEQENVRRAYWEHVRALARARICSEQDCTRERYPASYNYFAAPNKRPFPDDTTD